MQCATTSVPRTRLHCSCMQQGRYPPFWVLDRSNLYALTLDISLFSPQLVASCQSSCGSRSQLRFYSPRRYSTLLSASLFPLPLYGSRPGLAPGCKRRHNPIRTHIGITHHTSHCQPAHPKQSHTLGRAEEAVVCCPRLVSRGSPSYS